MEEIKNEKTPTTHGRCMSEEDILNEILLTEKMLSNNYSIAVNEMSNKILYKKILKILTDTKNITRELFNLAFEKGWYTLSTQSETTIENTLTQYSGKLKELS